MVFIKSHSTYEIGGSLKSRVVYITRSEWIIKQHTKAGCGHLQSHVTVGKCLPEGKSKPSAGMAKLERPLQNKHIPFSLQRPPIWNSTGRGAVPIVCGPWLAALPSADPHSCAGALTVRQPSISAHSLLWFQQCCRRVWNAGSAQLCYTPAGAKAKTTGYQSTADHCIRFLDLCQKAVPQNYSLNRGKEKKDCLP